VNETRKKARDADIDSLNAIFGSPRVQFWLGVTGLAAIAGFVWTAVMR
jgi:hypothetical protein